MEHERANKAIAKNVFSQMCLQIRQCQLLQACSWEGKEEATSHCFAFGFSKLNFHFYCDHTSFVWQRQRVLRVLFGLLSATYRYLRVLNRAISTSITEGYSFYKEPVIFRRACFQSEYIWLCHKEVIKVYSICLRSCLWSVSGSPK